MRNGFFQERIQVYIIHNRKISKTETLGKFAFYRSITKNGNFRFTLNISLDTVQNSFMRLNMTFLNLIVLKKLC